MECNKEEASRAKDLAEIKLQEADFVGAKRMALKAHQLFPGLENISQLLAVCEVHCCGAVKINGETDWYGILHVESTADEMAIKKQYRKLALLLHPDKNKFTGAEAAFKLIGEAHMTLTDHVKRSLHDKKRKPVFTTSSPLPRKRGRPQKKTDPVAKRANKENIDAADYQNKPQGQAGCFAGYSTFWTVCLACGTKYHYPCSLLMKTLLCQICSKNFVAYDLSKKPVGQTPYPWSGLGMQQKKFPPSQHVHATNQQQKYQSAPGWQNPFTCHRTHASHQKQQSPSVRDRQTPAANHHQQSQKLHFNSGSFKVANSQAASDPNKKGAADNDIITEAVVCNSTNVSIAGFKEGICADRTEPPLSADQMPTANMQKRGSEVSPGSSYPVSMDGSQLTPKDVLAAVSADKTAGQNPQRSSQGNNVICEDGYGDCRKDSDLPDSRVEKKKSEGYSSCNSGKSGEAKNEVTSVYRQQRGNIPSTERTPNENGKVINSLDHDGRQKMSKRGGMPSSVSDDSSRSGKDSIPCKVTVSCPDSDFYDFEKNRDADQFTVDQVWAIYDDHDGMPRYYARIKQVYSPNFMLRFTWLEHDPLSDAEKAWSYKELPVACGSFRIGRTILTEDTKMFSHVVSWVKGRKRNSYEIYPRKGEVWALFEEWNINWSSGSNDHKHYNYNIVQVKSDFIVSTGTCVVPLVKVKGFASLFVQSSKEPYLIPGGDTLRFSHSIPFHRLAGKDSQHIPHGALELDTASLPSDMEEVFSSVDLNSIIRTREDYTGCGVSPTRYSCKGEMPAVKSKQALNVSATNEENGS